MTDHFIFKPAFPKDETINSLLERSAACNSGGTLRTEGLRLLKRSRPLLDALPCSIRSFSQAFGVYGNELQLLEEHTLFNHFACGVVHGRTDEFRTRLLSDSRGPLRPARLPLFFGHGEQECLHCADCDEVNRGRYGFSFTYRQHSAAFVAVCPWHGTVLEPLHRRNTGYDQVCRKTGKGSDEAIREFAVRMADSIEIPWLTSSYRRTRLVDHLTERGWISESRRCAVSAFLDSFHKSFNDAFGDERLRLLCSERRYAEGALRALFRTDRNIHPVWCVMFRWLADGPRFVERARRYVEQPSAHKSVPSLESRLRVLRLSPSVTQASHILGISKSSLLCLCHEHGIPVSTRPKRIFEAKWREIAQHVLSGISSAEIAAKCGVSLSTVYRVTAATPGGKAANQDTKSKARLLAARQVWQRAVAQHPLCTATELRHRHLADWSYLYRHDRDWLVLHSPQGGRVHAKDEHVHLPQSLLALAAESIGRGWRGCETGTHLPQRRSAYRLQAITGLSEYALLRFRTMDCELTEGFVPETQPSFVLRRLFWVANRPLVTSGMKPWRWAKDASLRTSSIVQLTGSQSVINIVKGEIQQCQQHQSPQHFFYSDQEYKSANISLDMSPESQSSPPTRESK